jgi:hypothetical protein
MMLIINDCNLLYGAFLQPLASTVFAANGQTVDDSWSNEHLFENAMYVAGLAIEGMPLLLCIVC